MQLKIVASSSCPCALHAILLTFPKILCLGQKEIHKIKTNISQDFRRFPIKGRLHSILLIHDRLSTGFPTPRKSYMHLN
jgi:hypothetical protein